MKMQNKSSRALRRAMALGMSMALVVSSIVVSPSADAAKKKKPTLSAKKKTLTYNNSKKKSFTLKIKKNKVKKIKKTTWKTSKKSVVSISKKKKTSVKVTAKKKGSAKITATVKYTVKGSKKVKKVKLTCKVTSKKGSSKKDDDTSKKTNAPAATTPAGGGSQATAAPTKAGGQTTATAAPTDDGKATTAPTDDGKETAKPTDDGKETAKPTDDGKETAKPTDDGKATTAPINDGKATTAPTNDGKATTAPTNDGKATTAPTNDGKATTAPTNDGKATTAPTNDGKATTAPTNDGKATTAPTNDGKATTAPTTSSAAAKAELKIDTAPVLAKVGDTSTAVLSIVANDEITIKKETVKATMAGDAVIAKTATVADNKISVPLEAVAAGSATLTVSVDVEADGKTQTLSKAFDEFNIIEAGIDVVDKITPPLAKIGDSGTASFVVSGTGVTVLRGTAVSGTAVSAGAVSVEGNKVSVPVEAIKECVKDTVKVTAYVKINGKESTVPVDFVFENIKQPASGAVTISGSAVSGAAVQASMCVNATETLKANISEVSGCEVTGYRWSIEGDAVALAEGSSATDSTIAVKAVKAGTAKVKLEISTNTGWTGDGSRAAWDITVVNGAKLGIATSGSATAITSCKVANGGTIDLEALVDNYVAPAESVKSYKWSVSPSDPAVQINGSDTQKTVKVASKKVGTTDVSVKIKLNTDEEIDAKVSVEVTPVSITSNAEGITLDFSAADGINTVSSQWGSQIDVKPYLPYDFDLGAYTHATIKGELSGIDYDNIQGEDKSGLAEVWLRKEGTGNYWDSKFCLTEIGANFNATVAERTNGRKLKITAKETPDEIRVLVNNKKNAGELTFKLTSITFHLAPKIWTKDQDGNLTLDFNSVSVDEADKTSTASFNNTHNITPYLPKDFDLTQYSSVTITGELSGAAYDAGASGKEGVATVWLAKSGATQDQNPNRYTYLTSQGQNYGSDSTKADGTTVNVIEGLTSDAVWVVTGNVDNSKQLTNKLISVKFHKKTS